MEGAPQNPPGPPVFVQPAPATAAGPTSARLWARAAAVLIDIAVVVGFTFVLTAPVAWIYAPAGPFSEQAGWNATITAGSSADDLLVTALETLVLWVAWTVYLGAMTARRGADHGQTLGKSALGLRVVHTDGSPLSPAVAWRRSAWIPAIVGATSIAGVLADALLGTAPTLTHLADLAEYTALAVLAISVVRSPIRQALYDARLGTVVVSGGRA